MYTPKLSNLCARRHAELHVALNGGHCEGGAKQRLYQGHILGDVHIRAVTPAT